MFARLSNVLAGSIDFAISERSQDAADSRKRALSAAVRKRMTGGARDSSLGVNDVCFVFEMSRTSTEKNTEMINH